MTLFTHMFTNGGQDISEAEAYEMVTNPEHPKRHEAKLSYELLAAAASFAAAKAYEDKVKEEHGGVAPDHALASGVGGHVHRSDGRDRRMMEAYAASASRAGMGIAHLGVLGRQQHMADISE
ncbi:hypothetical protein B0H13DRAFT_1936751 [Mycena leptocephala]|nr:hypothetical protein B0H13DRAFT_1936751 [Mycena leptocephala]